MCLSTRGAGDFTNAMKQRQHRNHRLLAATTVAAALAAAGLALDLVLLPLNVTSGIAYVALVVLTLYTPRRTTTVMAAVLGVCGALFPLAVGWVPATMGVVLDRTLAVAAIAAAAALCLFWKSLQERNRRAQWFNQSILDALTAPTAVLDDTGAIRTVNAAWRKLAEIPDGPLSCCGVDTPFLSVCRIRSEDCAEEAPDLAEGIRHVLARNRNLFALEYNWDAPSGRRWYSVRVTRFDDGPRSWAVVEQEDITQRKQAELDAERSRQTYRELATHDELTGVHNRRALDRMLDEEVNRHHRYGTDLSLIMIDIDHFKAVNDTYGHPVGDAALKWLASLLARNVRVVDRLARYGGEEFAIIAPELTEPEAASMAERLRRLTADHPFTHETPDGKNLEIPITVSLGVASLSTDVQTPAQMVAAADRALYTAKRCGRNCTVQFRELEERVGS